MCSFESDGRRVALINTPGFDDTARSDTDVPRVTAVFLATSQAKRTPWRTPLVESLCQEVV
jgi:hypothetical protein